MTANVSPCWLSLRAGGLFTRLARPSGGAIAVGLFLALLLVQFAISPYPLDYYDLQYISAGGVPLALAAMGLTIVVIARGLDLSAGAVISLANVVLATQMQDTVASQVVLGLLALAIGAAVGAVNGFFVAFMRMPSIVVTLATMFIVEGVTLLIMQFPGGMIPDGFVTVLTGDVIPGVLPTPVLILAVALAVWLYLKNTRWGTALYAVGSDEEGAASSGLDVKLTRFLAFTAAGAFYGAAGAFISAQTGSGDPLVGKPMLLTVFAAVVVGGTPLSGGRGGCFGSIFGAYVLRMAVNVLLVFGVSSYWTSGVEAAILLAAALAHLSRGGGRLLDELRRSLEWVSLPRAGKLARQAVALKGLGEGRLSEMPRRGFLQRHAELLRMSLPSIVGLVLVLIVTAIYFGPERINAQYLSSVIVLSSFLLILAFGQGAVILSGGLDLSIPWTITFCAILMTTLSGGSDANVTWVIPTVLIAGAAIGLLNGLVIAVVGITPIVATLAMNAVLQTVALLYCNGTPSGFSPPLLRAFMTGSVLGVRPMVWFALVFVALGLLVMTRMPFARRLRAVGSNPHAAFLCGISVKRTLVATYAISGCCAALVGMLLAGFDGQATLGMGDPFLLPSIAVVVVGGTVITGGRGHYFGMVCGVLFLVALQVLLAGSSLPSAARSIVFGGVILLAVVLLREGRSR